MDNPPLVDVSVSQHMGLFAVSRLAARHGVRVRLRAATPRGLSVLAWLPDSITGREAPGSMKERPGQLASDYPLTRRRSAGRQPAGDGQPGSAGQPAASGGRSNWFRAKRPSGRSARGAGLSVAALSAADSTPDEGQAMPAAPAQDTSADTTATPVTHARGMPGTPAQSATAWGALGRPTRQAAAQDSQPGTDQTAAGLPQRTPGVNLVPGSARGRTAESPATHEARAPGREAGNSETEQVTPQRQAPLPRRSPELARARLSGFQLGSREAEAEGPSSGHAQEPSSGHAQEPSSGEAASR
jgi:hypothetical protein